MKGSDTVTNLTETYASPNVGTGITLNVATYTINDGNSGNNYTVTKVPNNTGVITSSSSPANLYRHGYHHSGQLDRGLRLSRL